MLVLAAQVSMASNAQQTLSAPAIRFDIISFPVGFPGINGFARAVYEVAHGAVMSRRAGYRFVTIALHFPREMTASAFDFTIDASVADICQRRECARENAFRTRSATGADRNVNAHQIGHHRSRTIQGAVPINHGAPSLAGAIARLGWLPQSFQQHQV